MSRLRMRGTRLPIPPPSTCMAPAEPPPVRHSHWRHGKPPPVWHSHWRHGKPGRQLQLLAQLKHLEAEHTLAAKVRPRAVGLEKVGGGARAVQREAICTRALGAEVVQPRVVAHVQVCEQHAAQLAAGRGGSQHAPLRADVWAA
eukprot:217908-Chlamydomonas_euryale.AAC.1